MLVKFSCFFHFIFSVITCYEDYFALNWIGRASGEVNMSLSGVVKFASKTEKLVQNEVILQLMDSFSNPVLSMQSKLKLEIDSINKSDFTIGAFMDNNDGSYRGQYMIKNVGSYELCVLFNGNYLLPCPCDINAYSSK